MPKETNTFQQVTDWYQMDALVTIKGRLDLELTNLDGAPVAGWVEQFTPVDGFADFLPAVNSFLQEATGIPADLANTLWKPLENGEERCLSYRRTHHAAAAEARDHADTATAALSVTRGTLDQAATLHDTDNGAKVVCWQAYETLGRVAQEVAKARAALKNLDRDRGWNWIARKGG